MAKENDTTEDRHLTPSTDFPTLSLAGLKCLSVHGRIAALLEPGAGFNPEFTGRENVYLNAAVLGMRRDEIDSRFGDIEAFANTREFMGCSYVSGSRWLLAWDPDILVAISDATCTLANEDTRFDHCITIPPGAYLGSYPRSRLPRLRREGQRCATLRSRRIRDLCMSRLRCRPRVSDP